MRARSCAVAVVCAAALVVAGSAGASGGTSARVLKLVSRTVTFTPVGFSFASSTQPPVGARYILDAALFNQVAQFGKAAGARVGNVEIECTFATSLRTLCAGVAHLPNGFLTFSGAPLVNGGNVEWYAVTGGVSAYADVRGQIKATDVGGDSGNKTAVVVTLFG